MKTLDSREGYNLYAPNYRKDHQHLDSFDWVELQPLIVKQLELLMAEAGNSPIRLLDLGCGDGRILKRLARLREQRNWYPQLELHGWDISEGMLKQARKALPADLQLERHDLLSVPTGLPAFNLICSFFVLVHIGHPADFLTAASALLADAGIFIFNSIPQKEALVLENAGHKFQIDYEHHEVPQILDCLDDSDFKLVQQLGTPWSDLFVVQKKGGATN